LRFRHLLEQHGLTQALFNSITGLLEERRAVLRSGNHRRTRPSSRREFDQDANHRGATGDPEDEETHKGATGTSG